MIQALVQVIAKITKLGWFDVQKDQLIFRDIVADVKKFLQVGKIEQDCFLKNKLVLLNIAVVITQFHIVMLKRFGMGKPSTTVQRSANNCVCNTRQMQTFEASS